LNIRDIAGYKIQYIVKNWACTLL